jgi:spore maturation protein CgeB
MAAACEVIVNIDSHLSPDAVTMFRNYGVRVAFWFPDCVLSMGRALMLLAPYNALFFKEPHLIERLRSTLDLPAYYLPEACNPRWHKPVGPAGGEPYLVVAGNMYPSRVTLLERLIDKGIPVKIYGPKFSRWITAPRVRNLHTGVYLAREEKARIFRSAAGVLNTLHPAEIRGVNARLFEAAGCGAAVLTEFRPVVPDLFKVGDEVLAFNDFDELMEQATFLLNDSSLGARLGEAASARAHRDHTYELRLTTILERVM